MTGDQASKLRQKLADNQSERTARTIAIASGKGGAGKSNVALNFSLDLLHHDKKVLLFDLDIGMGNLDILLGLDPKATIIDMFANRSAIQDIIETGPLGLAYVAGGSALNDFFRLGTEEQDYFFQAFDDVTYLYDYIIFDMGAGASEETMTFVMASDECMVVANPEPTSITDAYGLIKHIVHSRWNMPISLIMNRSPSVKNGRKALVRFQRVVQQFLNHHIRLLGTLPDDRTVSDAVLQQVPYILLNDKAAVSRAMRKLTSDYLRDDTTNEQLSRSFVQKLKMFMSGDKR
ncbi:flagellum location/number ATPase FlhG [Barrientosiimonas marina]|uniref:MinD/ParA family protein n=1 Tax=Lentibacillus kimchii TaxID=1542911 RepID=A0ABW2URE4_9BACI